MHADTITLGDCWCCGVSYNECRYTAFVAREDEDPYCCPECKHSSRLTKTPTAPTESEEGQA